MRNVSIPPFFNKNGWHVNARYCFSPNFTQVKKNPENIIRIIVIHAISLPPECFEGDGVERLFLNELDSSQHPYYEKIYKLKVSAHFFIRRDGELIQFVSTLNRAWHAGVSSWNGRERCNDFSIGIELEGSDTQPFEDIQYLKLAELVSALQNQYPTIEDIVGHSDIAPGRKTDPGPFFDWAYFRYLIEKKAF